MNFLNLTVRNLGVFRGQHHFDFTPVQPSNRAHSASRHLTVISGHNGSGKSTLFQVFALALYGPLALGERVSRQAYSDVLLNRLHRYSDTNIPIICDEGGVELNLRYIQSGRPLQIRIERHWQRRGRNVIETLMVFQDGQPPDVAADDYQSWVNDLMPPGLASVCFFDAERLETFASPEYHDAVLIETLRRLFGLDLMERLQTDLEHYTLRRGGGRRADRIREEVLQYQANLDALEAQCNQLQVEAQTWAATQGNLEAELAKQERRLVAEGGSYAARRPILQERLAALQGEIEGAANDMRELCVDLLPFVLVPALCQDLGQRLIQESEVQRYRVAGELWQKRVESVRASLKDKHLWQGLDVSPEVRSRLIQRLVQALEMPLTSDAIGGQPFIHHLAEPEQEQLQVWIAKALHTVPTQALALGERLRALHAERRQIEEEWRRVPSDEVLAPIADAIARLQAELSALRQQKTTLDKQIGAIQFQRDEQSRQLQRMADQFAAAQRNEQQLEHAQRSTLALRAYQDALTRQRLLRLEEALLTAFNTICHKGRLLSVVHISPEDFRIQLTFPSADLSLYPRGFLNYTL